MIVVPIIIFVLIIGAFLLVVIMRRAK
jgi:hypothetical protein